MLNRALENMSDQTLQQSNVIFKMLGMFTFADLKSYIVAMLERGDYNDRGTIEYIKGDYVFYIDYDVVEGKANFYCHELYLNGDKIESPWINEDFDMYCQPEF